MVAPMQFVESADGREPHGGLPGAVGVATDGRETPWLDSPVLSVWLQMARSPMDGGVGAVGVAGDGQEPHKWTPRCSRCGCRWPGNPINVLPGAVGVAADGRETPWMDSSVQSVLL